MKKTKSKPPLLPLIIAGLLIISGLTIAAILITTEIKNKKALTQNHLTIDFLDIGQGDATLITTPSGTQVLIDGGRNTQVLHQLGKHMKWWDRSLDMIVATHGDADHIGGLIDVIERFNINHIMIDESFYEKETSVTKAFHREVEYSKIKPTYIEEKQKIIVDEKHDISLTVLWPSNTVLEEFDDTNEHSIVLLLSYGEVQTLLMGDTGVEVEEIIVKEYPELVDVEILKLGHHGSSTSTSEEFINATTPEFAIASAGKDNSYGHPHSEVKELLQQNNIPWLCTCDEGTISVVMNGQRWWIEE